MVFKINQRYEMLKLTKSTVWFDFMQPELHTDKCDATVQLE